MPDTGPLLCMQPDYYLLHKLLAAGSVIADGPHSLCIVNVGMWTITTFTFSQKKETNTVYINYFPENPA